MFEDSTFWLFVTPGFLLGLYAQGRIKANYVRYSRVGTSGGIAGAQVARALLDARGLQSVRIESTPGLLSDQYDPVSKTLRLSPEVYYTPSLAAAGIAAHETGHALQDAVGELWPEVGDGGNREGGISWGCLTPPLLQRRSDMPCPTITSSD